MTVAMLAAAAAAGIVCRPMHPNPDALAERIAAEGERHPKMKAAQQAETQLDVIDLLIAFDQSAVKWMTDNRKGSPTEYAAKCVEKLNYCLEQSHLLDHFHFRLAGTVVIAKDASSMSLINVVLSMIDEYGRVVSSGEWKKITDARAAVGADIVTVMTACGAYGNVGQGFSLESDWGGRSGAAIKAFGDWAYNACAIEAVDNGYTQMHEIGHNMGCGHPDDAMAPGLAAMSTLGYKATGPQFYDYSSGWYLWDSGIGYYTVMSYNWGGVGPDGGYNSSLRFKPLPFLSNPRYTWKGHALGDANHDNRRTMINTYKYVAQYRVSMVSDEKPGTNPAEPLPVVDPEPEIPEVVIPDPELPEGVEGVMPVKPSEIVSGLALAKAVVVGGCVLDADWLPSAAVSFRIGKAGKKGTKVSGSVTSFTTGRKTILKTATVDLSHGPRTLSFEVRGMGPMSVKLGLNAAGQVVYAGMVAGKVVTSAAVGGDSVIGRKAFAMTAVPAVVKDMEVNAEFLPDGEPVDMQGRKWVLAKPALVAYKKDKATGAKHWVVNNGKSDSGNTNLSGLKLAYRAKDGLFTGSFYFYGLRQGQRKKVKANVRGVVVDGAGHGLAAVKGVDGAVWRIAVK